jgi:hypothetical protein
MAVRWLPFTGAVIACALIVACGGDSKKDDASPTAGASGGSTAAAGTTARAGATAAPTTDSGGGGGGEPNEEIRDVASKFADSTFSATYKATGTDPDAGTGGTLALVKDGNTKFRFDVTTQQDGEDVAVVFIQTEENSAFCLKDAGEFGALVGIEPGEGVCFKTSEGDATNPVGNIKELFSDIENVNVTVLEKTSRKIAGEDGTCYRTKDNETADLSTVCFSDDGVLLYVKSEGDAPSEIEAQTVSSDVDDGDFTLPYEERELPGGLGGQ